MIHLDLFSGTGGFAYAIDQVFENVEHIFCDNNKFCQQVIKKHWPNSKIYGDIREIRFDSHSDSDRRTGGNQEINPTETGKQALDDLKKCDGVITSTNHGRQTKQEKQATGDKQC